MVLGGQPPGRVGRRRIRFERGLTAPFGVLGLPQVAVGLPPHALGRSTSTADRLATRLGRLDDDDDAAPTGGSARGIPLRRCFRRDRAHRPRSTQDGTAARPGAVVAASAATRPRGSARPPGDCRPAVRHAVPSSACRRRSRTARRLRTSPRLPPRWPARVLRVPRHRSAGSLRCLRRGCGRGR